MNLVKILFLLLSLLLSPTQLLAANAISCHCFQDREYNPDQPGAADEYILATSRNSFLSALYGMPKKSIVKARMGGTPAEDLWLAGYLAQQTGQTVAELLAMRQASAGWNELLASLPGFPESIDPEVVAPVLARQPVSAIVSALIDLEVKRHLRQSAATVAALRSAGASDQQLILVAFLARQTGSPAVDIIRQRRKKAIPWDIHLDSLGISPRQIDPLLRKAMG